MPFRKYKFPLRKIGSCFAVAIFFLVLLAETSLLVAQDGFVNPDIDFTVVPVLLEPTGKILIGGMFNNVAGQPRTKMARLNSNGTLDTDFQNLQLEAANPPDYWVGAIARQTDGKILIGGRFTKVLGQTRNDLARLNADGTLDTSFIANVNGAVFELAIQPDGKVLIGGDFTMVGGQVRNCVARLNADGSLDPTFLDPNIPVLNGIQTMALQSDGKVLVGGYFTTVGGQPKPYAARLNTNGSLDTSFNLIVNGPVSQFLFQPDGKMLICGRFTNVNGVTMKTLARLNPDSSIDSTLGNVDIPSGSVETLGLQADGKIVVAGDFSQISGVEREKLTRLNSDGTVDESFQNPNSNSSGSFSSIISIIIQSDGKILLGGSFSMVGGQQRKNLVRLRSDGTLDRAPAQIRIVTKTADTNDGVCDADCSLREAVDASTNMESSQINFDSNVFNTPKTITLSSGEIAFPEGRGVTINGPGSSQLTISGGNSSRIFRVRRDTDITIIGLRMTNGNGVGPAPGDGYGGAVFVDNSTRTQLTIKNSVFENNLAHSGGAIGTLGRATVSILDSLINANTADYGPGGGGVYFDSGTLNITNSTVSANNATFPNNGGAGGIVANSQSGVLNITGSTVSGNSGDVGGVAVAGMATISGTTIRDNQSTVLAGGLYVRALGNVTLTGSTVSRNSLTSGEGGGGIKNIGPLSIINSSITSNSARFGGGVSTSGNLSILGSTITQNSAIESGGGIYNNAGSSTPVTVTMSTVEGNVAGATGGGIYNRNRMDLVNSTIRSNRSTLNGGGVYNTFLNVGAATVTVTGSTINGNRSDTSGAGVANQTGTVTLINSTLSGNVADVVGGGVTNNTNGTVSLSSCTVAFNTAGSLGGGGVNNSQGTITIRNTLIAKNESGGGPDIRGTLTSDGHNLIGNTTGGTVGGTGTGNIFNTDPLLSTLADHSGLTFTHALLEGSPAIDSGNAGSGVTVDQRGVQRPIDLASISNAPSSDSSDIGAFERQANESTFFLISGRVTASDGRGITNARVVVTSETLPGPVTIVTGRNGVFVFNNLVADHSFVITVSARRFTFDPPFRIITLTANVTDTNFIALPPGSIADEKRLTRMMSSDDRIFQEENRRTGGNIMKP